MAKRDWWILALALVLAGAAGLGLWWGFCQEGFVSFASCFRPRCNLWISRRKRPSSRRISPRCPRAA